MVEISRDFKGIWIPKEVWLDKSLTYFEKCFLAEIHSLNGKDGCYASNEYFCTFFDERERKIQDSLAKLKSKGYIWVESFDGRTRVLRTNLTPNDKLKFSTSAVSKIDTSDLSKIDTPSYIERKEDILLPSKKKKKKKEEADLNQFSPEQKEKILEIINTAKENQMPFSEAAILDTCIKYSIEATLKFLSTF